MKLLLIGGFLSNNLRSFIQNPSLDTLFKVEPEEYRVYMLAKSLQEFEVTVAIPKNSNYFLNDLDVSIVTYNEKLWDFNLEKIIRNFELIIYSKNNILGLPVLYNSRKKVILDLWNSYKFFKKETSNKEKFYQDIITKPLLYSMLKRSIVIVVSDIQGIFLNMYNKIKLPFMFEEGNFFDKNAPILLYKDRNYYSKLKNKKITPILNSDKLSLFISLDKDPLYFNWREYQIAHFKIPVLGDKRNSTIKELKRTGLSFGCDSTSLYKVEKTIKNIEQKNFKYKKPNSILFDNFKNFVKKSGGF